MIYSINLLLLILYALAFITNKYTGIALPQWIFGSLVFFLPGLNFIFFIKKLMKRSFGLGMNLILVLASSLIIVPLLTYIVYLYQIPLSQSTFLVITLITAFIPLHVAYLIELRRKTFSLGLIIWGKLVGGVRQYKELVIASLAYVVIMGVHFYLYKFIPEADSYTYLKNLEAITANPLGMASDSRPLFNTLLLNVHYLTDISLYSLFKYGLPLLIGSLLLVLFCFLYEEGKKKYNALILLLPLAFPVIVLEFLIPRPQLVLLALLPIVLFLYYCALKYQDKLFFAIAITLSLVSIKYHELGIILLAILGPMLILFFWDDIKRNKAFSFGLAIYGLVGVYPYLAQSGLLTRLLSYGSLVVNAITQGEFRWWFISDYKNVDGSIVGWPGRTWLLYYGYNIGLVLPFVLALSWGRKKEKTFSWYLSLPFLITGAIFFFVAEILPRFGLGFLPDRAWLFFIVSLQPVFAWYSFNALKGKFSSLIFYCLVALSIGVSFYVTYAKQGWVTQEEYNAVQWLNTNSETNSIVISQRGARPLQAYFLQRNYYFFSGPKETIYQQFDEVIRSPEILQENYNTAVDTQQDLQAKIVANVNKLFLTRTKKTLESIQSEIKDQTRQYVNNQLILDAIIMKGQSSKDGPIYFMYSKAKFDGLYGSRQWWKDFNWYGLDTDDLTRHYSLVYNQQNVMIWKVK